MGLWISGLRDLPARKGCGCIITRKGFPKVMDELFLNLGCLKALVVIFMECMLLFMRAFLTSLDTLICLLPRTLEGLMTTSPLEEVWVIS